MKTITYAHKRFDDVLFGKGIILWGAGPNVPKAISLLERLGLKDSIVGIFDCTRVLEESVIHGVKVIPSEEVRKFSHDDNVILACAGLNELYGYIVPQHLFYFRIIHRKALEFYAELDDLALHKIQNNIDLFTDDYSKMVYERRVELVLSSVMFDSHFKSLGGPYFANDLIDSVQGTWLYAGAYNGRHLDRALKFNANQEIIAIEPSRSMYDFLVDKFSDNRSIDLNNYLLWSRSGEKIKFNDDSTHQGLAASIFQNEDFGSNRFVETITIDDLLSGRSVSQIALDVEGSEQHAIRGAKRTIETFSPTCAVCLYHNLDDYINLPSMVHEMTGARYLSVRQHSCIPFIENVLYAYN